MEKYDMTKLNKLLKWAERVRMLEEATGHEINEMLGQYANFTLHCDKCPLRGTCNDKIDTCDVVWKNFLEVKI